MGAVIVHRIPIKVQDSYQGDHGGVHDRPGLQQLEPGLVRPAPERKYRALIVSIAYQLHSLTMKIGYEQ